VPKSGLGRSLGIVSATDDMQARLARFDNTGVHHQLGITAVELTPERVVLTLPVGPKVHQPHGILHGGVSVVVAESAASCAGSLNVGPDKAVVGIEVSASHLRSISEGTLTATAIPIRIGRAIQVWRIELVDQDGRAICDAKCTLAVIDRPSS